MLIGRLTKPHKSVTKGRVRLGGWKKNNIMKYFLLLLKIIFPLSIVLIIFQFVAFDIGWYKKEFVKYGVFEQLGEERVINQTDNLVLQKQ